jgi:hypothetical protein
MQMIKAAIFLSVFSAAIVLGSEDIRITAAKPTHYFYTPTAYVNPPNRLVISLHEISYSLPEHLQVQASLFDNIGRINFGAKYGFSDDLSLGLGIASSLASFGGHGIKQGNPARFGAFLAYGLIKKYSLEASVTAHAQLFDHNSIGCDLGGMFTPSDLWSFIWEFGTSFDLSTDPTLFWFNTDGGIRIHPPSIPFMNFDLGMDVQEFPINVSDARTRVRLYLDVIFAMVAR